MLYTQENRFIAIETPLGKDELLLAGFSGTERISELFSFELDFLSENHNIVFKNIIGKNVTVSVVLSDGDKRYFNGVISRFSQERGGGESGADARFSYYSATMVPWFWLLTRTADSRIFQNLSVPDIIEKIFKEKGFIDYKMLVHGSYEKKVYCVQYRETDFNFVSRLLEQEGIYYFFEHEKKKHTLILSDSPEEHKPCPKQKSARCDISAGGWQDEDVITGMDWHQEIRIGKYTVSDFNFEIPTTDLKVEIPSQHALGPGEREVYDYPAEFFKRAEGERLGNIRMQEEEAQITTLNGSSVCRSFTSGYRFTLKGFYRDEMNNKDYVLTSVHHEVNEPIGASADQSGASYTNSFTCIPHKIPFRPPRHTPKPMVEGVQTAIVVGPSGEEIYPDKHGRVKVQFHWDREGKRDDKSSCWIRVSQVWAGAGWGAMFIPHIGHEVVVDFIEGDPDRPIIIGRVYHGTNTPADALPDEKTKSVIRSWKDNDIVIEDKDGDKHIHIKQACGNEIIMHEKTPNIEIKQACGNEILMREAEGVQIRDKYGNEVVLDAVAGLLRLYSPTHETKMELGKSFWLGTMSDCQQNFQGNAFTTVHGMKEDYVVGPVKLKYDGTNIKIHGGLVSDIFGGVKQSSVFGAELKNNLSVVWEKGASKTIKEVAGKVKIDSQVETKIIGGGGKADTSKLTLDGSKVRLECGSSFIEINKDADIKIRCTKLLLDVLDEIELDATKFDMYVDTTTFHGKTVDMNATRSDFHGSLKVNK